MSMDVEKKIKSVMSSVFDIPIEHIDENSSHETIENWDSLRQMNLVLALEEEFSITFNENEIIDLENFKLIRITIKEKLNI